MTTTTNPATDKQIAFLRRLAAERVALDDRGRDDQGRTIADVLGAELLEQVLGQIDRAQASKTIDTWLKHPVAGPNGPYVHAVVTIGAGGAPQIERRTPPVLVPEGHYAVASTTGANDLDYFRVDRPTDGKWAGYTFVKRIVGGHPDYPVRGAARDAVLARIAEAGPAEAGALYGQTIGRCGRCNRHLTDEASRAAGYGPECRTKI